MGLAWKLHHEGRDALSIAEPPWGSTEVWITQPPECPGVPRGWGAVGSAQHKSPEELPRKNADLYMSRLYSCTRPFLHQFPDGVVGNASLTELKVPRGLTGWSDSVSPSWKDIPAPSHPQKILNTNIAPSAGRDPRSSSLSKQLYKVGSKKVG